MWKAPRSSPRKLSFSVFCFVSSIPCNNCFSSALDTMALAWLPTWCSFHVSEPILRVILSHGCQLPKKGSDWLSQFLEPHHCPVSWVQGNATKTWTQGSQSMWHRGPEWRAIVKKRELRERPQRSLLFYVPCLGFCIKQPSEFQRLCWTQGCCLFYLGRHVFKNKPFH